MNCKIFKIKNPKYGVGGRLVLAVKSLYSISEVCVFWAELNYNCSPHVLNSDKVCAITTPLHGLYMNWKGMSQPSRRQRHCWELQDQPFALQTIWYFWHHLNSAFNMHPIGFLLHATKPE